MFATVRLHRASAGSMEQMPGAGYAASRSP
jgi:hypothetical protein